MNLPYDSTPTGPYSQHLTQQSSDHSETHVETAVAGGDGYLQTDPVTSKREVGFCNFHDHHVFIFFMNRHINGVHGIFLFYVVSFTDLYTDFSG